MNNPRHGRTRSWHRRGCGSCAMAACGRDVPGSGNTVGSRPRLRAINNPPTRRTAAQEWGSRGEVPRSPGPGHVCELPESWAGPGPARAHALPRIPTPTSWGLCGRWRMFPVLYTHPKRNLLIVLPHGLRSDALADEREWPLPTPHLVDLARRGVRLVLSAATTTDPGAMASVLTGLHARQHGDNCGRPTGPDSRRTAPTRCPPGCGPRATTPPGWARWAQSRPCWTTPG